MSTVALSAAALAALAFLSMQDDSSEDDHTDKAEKAKPDGSLDTRFNSGAIYSDVRDTREILDMKGMIIGEEVSTDLSGVPCRFLKMQNGLIIRTYDMQTQFIC